MEMTQNPTSTPSRIHPLVAGAAVSVTLVSLLGVAALSGLLPNSHGSIESQAAASQTSATQTVTPVPVPVNTANSSAPVLVQTPAGYQYMQPVTAPTAAYQQVTPHNATPAGTTPTHHTQHTQHHHAQTYAQADTRQPVYQQQQRARPANSPVGIATGAVVGGLLGNQVGHGNGRTLATVAGAVGGGYLGNMAGQKYGY